MAARSIASLTVSFGLVSIPVKLHSATEASRRFHSTYCTRPAARGSSNSTSASRRRWWSRARRSSRATNSRRTNT